jgi:hypothetical protein
MNLNEGEQKLLPEEVTSKPSYMAPQIDKIGKVELVTNGSRNNIVDSNTGLYQTT